MYKRDRLYYAVAAVLGEEKAEQPWPPATKEEIEAEKAKLLAGWEAQIYVLPKRVLCEGDFGRVWAVHRQGLGCRIYPPSALDQKGELAGLLKGAQFPVGQGNVTHMRELSSSAVTGLVAEPSLTEGRSYRRAIRFDMQEGFDSEPVFRELVDVMAMYTKQWWLRLGYDPFSGPLRLSGRLTKTFDFAEEHRFKGAGKVESVWRAINATQNLLGFEQPLTDELWQQCAHCVREGIPAERGILFFLDAIAHYMAGDDEQSILNLALSFEVLANKRYHADKGKYLSSNKELQKASSLVSGENRDALHALIIDRDHVAHGRDPYLLHQGKWKIENYLEAGQSVLNNYLKSVESGQWPQLAQMKLDSSRKR